jgi:beta-lactamase regulating signal transducer with metallopeptidase domain
MSAGSAMIPDAVYTIWWIGLILTLVVFVPLAVYSLHRTWNSARSIQRYAAETLHAAAGIARNTANISALDTTINVATEVLGAAGAVERKLTTVASVLEERRRRRR